MQPNQNPTRRLGRDRYQPIGLVTILGRDQSTAKDPQFFLELGLHLIPIFFLDQFDETLSAFKFRAQLLHFSRF